MSRISYDALAVDGLKEVMVQISKTCKNLDIGFFIIGALARNIWLVANNERSAGTRDVDFGIYVPSEDKYNQLRKVLMYKYGYYPSEENAFCLLTPDGKQIDLLPFGKIEKDDRVMIEGKGLTEVNLVGFKEVYNVGATEVRIGDEVYKSCTIPGVVILKMIAFDDRPDRRIKDVKDINLICKHYPDIETDLIWNYHFDLYQSDRDHSDVAMIVLGREMRKIITGNAKLMERILNILDDALSQKSHFMAHMIDDPLKETIEMKADLLKHIKQGVRMEE